MWADMEILSATTERSTVVCTKKILLKQENPYLYIFLLEIERILDCSNVFTTLARQSHNFQPIIGFTD